MRNRGQTQQWQGNPMSTILVHRRWVAAVLAVFILVPGVLLVVCRTSPQQRLKQRTDGKLIVPGPALRAELAAMLEEDGLDIENYDIEVLYSGSGWRPEVYFSCTLKEELDEPAGGPALGEFFYTVCGMPPDLYESLMKKDAESGRSAERRDLVRSPEAAVTLAQQALDAKGISVNGRTRTVKSTDTFWIIEYRLPEEKGPLADDSAAKAAAYEVITAAVSKKTGKVQVFQQ